MADPITKTTPRCNSCRYGHFSEREGIKSAMGWCRRHAPVIHTLLLTTEPDDESTTEPDATWPTVGGAHWCGDYEEEHNA